MTRTSRRVKRMHRAVAPKMSLREFAQKVAADGHHELDTWATDQVRKWWKNKQDPPRKAPTNRFRGRTEKNDRRPRGARW